MLLPPLLPPQCHRVTPAKTITTPPWQLQLSLFPTIAATPAAANTTTTTKNNNNDKISFDNYNINNYDNYDNNNCDNYYY